MTGYNDLASELVDIIFDELCSSALSLSNDGYFATAAYKKKKIFRSCLPVSADFRHRILSRLCSFISISLHNAATNVTRFREVISRPSNSRLEGIGFYIKHFSLDYPSFVIGDPDLKILAKILDNQDLLAILEGLKGEHFGVEELSLEIYKIDVPWADVPGFRSTLRSLLLSPHLTRLNIKNFALPSETLFSGTHLKYLSIRGYPDILGAGSAGNKKVVVPSTLLALPFPTLLELHTDHSPGDDSDLLPASMLEKLKVYKEFENEGLRSAKTWQLLGLSASSLTEIYISHIDVVVKPPESFNLGVVHNLRVFEYSRHSGYQHRFDSSTDQTPSILFHLFNVTEPMEYLNTINVHFNLQERSVNELFLQRTITDSSWASLDGVLTGPYFPCLRNFEFLVTLEAEVDYRPDFDKRVFLRASKHCFKSSFRRIIAQENLVFLLVVKVSRIVASESSDDYSVYSDGGDCVYSSELDD